MKKLLFATLLTLASSLVFADNVRVLISTSEGDIEAELFAKDAPLSVENFLRYADEAWYENTIFHRVIPGFMIQGGGFTTNHQRKKTYSPIQNEAQNGLKNTRGTLAMARTNDPHSATSQFFINSVDNDSLNHTHSGHPASWGYAVFGKVTKGMDVVDAISATPTGRAALSGYPAPDVPKTPVIIKSVTRIEAAE